MAAGQLSGVGAQQTPTFPRTIAGGELCLRLLRDGKWAMGAEESLIADGAMVIINPLSTQHGYNCWTDRALKDGENEKLDEQMWKITQFIAEKDNLPVMFDPLTQKLCILRFQMSFKLKLIDGKCMDQHAIETATSVDGQRLIDHIMNELECKLDKGSRNIFLIVRLGSDRHQSGNYARITYLPLMDILGWTDLLGAVEATGETMAAPPASKKNGAKDASTVLRCI